jgi:hypothetical protein
MTIGDLRKSMQMVDPIYNLARNPDAPSRKEKAPKKVKAT